MKHDVEWLGVFQGLESDEEGANFRPCGKYFTDEKEAEAWRDKARGFRKLVSCDAIRLDNEVYLVRRIDV